MCETELVEDPPMPLPPVRFTIRIGMVVVAVTVGLAAIITSSYWILLLVLPALSFLLQRRAPTTEFFCTLVGIFVGALRIMPVENYRPTMDLRDFEGLLWVVVGAGVGALIGAAVASVDRRIGLWAERPSDVARLRLGRDKGRQAGPS
jgi:hypothetical protein